MPDPVKDMACLELGAGAGQNSIALARRGGKCTAVDISPRQLEHGRRLATEAGVHVEFVEADMAALPFANSPAFDLIHSTYALPFCDDPEAVIAAAAALLTAAGVFVLTVAHPVFSGEWLEVEEDGQGMFLRDYFRPPPDTRTSQDDDDAWTQARAWPVSEIFHWITDAGLDVDRIVEPEPLPVPTMDETEICRRIPYDSPAWRELYGQIRHIPPVAIFRARKDKSGS
jgi:SAM-dependent methyltransferase